MLIEIYLPLLLLAGGSLFFGITKQKWILCMFASIMFLTLAISAFRIEVVSGGVTLIFEEGVLILLNWLGSIVGLVFTLVGAIAAFRNRNQRVDMQQGR